MNKHKIRILTYPLHQFKNKPRKWRLNFDDSMDDLIKRLSLPYIYL